MPASITREQRFVAEDPLDYAAGDSNLSAYVFNAPTIHTDPTGEITPIMLVGCALGASGSAAAAAAGVGAKAGAKAATRPAANAGGKVGSTQGRPAFMARRAK